MNSAGIRHTVIALFLLIAAVGVGCDRHMAGGTAAASKLAKDGPEARFQIIIDSFRRKVEEPQIGFVVRDGDSRSTMIGTNKVSYELVPPATSADPYRAVITVASQSRYSLRHTKSGTDDSDRDQKINSQNKNALADPADKNGADILPPDLSSKPSGDSSKAASKSSQSNDEVVSRRPDEVIRKYELTYVNGRWSLVTKPNPDTEKSIQFAFEQALAAQ